MDKKAYLTQEGLADLKKELMEMKEKKRPRLVKRLAKARAMGDLSENSEYTSARQELSMLDNRLEELEKVLNEAKIIKSSDSKASCKTVRLGCKVTVKVNGKDYIYSVVGEWEADPLEKKISHNSPLGKALLGKKVGDQVKIQAPAGKIVYQIKKIH